MSLKILFFIVLMQTSFLALAQTFEEEYVPPEFEDELISEDVYYAPEPVNGNFQEAQEEQFTPEAEPYEWNNGDSEFPEDEIEVVN